jgi:hypothetical protein
MPGRFMSDTGPALALNFSRLLAAMCGSFIVSAGRPKATCTEFVLNSR